MNTIAVVVALVCASWLLLKVVEWWQLGTSYRQLSRQVVVEPRLAEYRLRIDEAAELLAELQTPGWYDRAWPICDNLDVSSDGEYCRRCFRQVSEHRRVVAWDITAETADFLRDVTEAKDRLGEL